MNTVKCRKDLSKKEMKDSIQACLLSDPNWMYRLGIANGRETIPLDKEDLYELVCEIDVFVRLTDAGWVPLKERPEGEAVLWHSQVKKAAQRFSIVNDALFDIKLKCGGVPRIVKQVGRKETYYLAVAEFANIAELKNLEHKANNALKRYKAAEPYLELAKSETKRFIEDHSSY